MQRSGETKYLLVRRAVKKPTGVMSFFKSGTKNVSNGSRMHITSGFLWVNETGFHAATVGVSNLAGQDSRWTINIPAP